MIELYNDSTDPFDLTGLRLTDDAQNPDKFTFPDGAFIEAGEYLVLFANNPDGTTGYHLGFNLNQDGETVYLYDSVVEGGALLDSVTFGVQLTDLSIGRLIDGSWGLTTPTFGSVNHAAPTSDASPLKLNEWLAIGQSLFANDFIELYNPNTLPVSLGGLYLSDETMGWPDRHAIAPLTFISGYGYLRFLADSDPGQGPLHLDFTLSADQGSIGLFDASLTPIDLVTYQAQQPDISQGRSPNGSSTIVFFTQPTPGGPNPRTSTAPQAQVIPILSMDHVWRYDQSGADLGTAWRESGYDDNSWSSGPALLGYETTTLTEPIRTQLSVSSAQLTYYFRTVFVAPTNGNLVGLQITHYLDDGAIFYLNGQELLRVNMPAGIVNSSTLAPNSVGDAVIQGPEAVSTTALQPGNNVLAVEVHQSSTSSSDVIFGLSLDALAITNSSAGGSVVLNEVLAVNSNLTEADGSTPDWIELYNQSAGPVDLGDLSLTDDTTLPRRWVFSTGTIVAPGGYFRVRCNSSQPVSSTNTGFGLKGTGGAVYLFDNLASGGGLLDSIAYGLQIPDLSVGRSPNGVGTNWVLGIPSPTAANLPVTSLGSATDLKINEWMAAPGSGDDWFELFNPGTQPVAIGGLHLTDDLTDPLKQPISPLSFIGAGTNAWLQFHADGNIGAGADHVSFGLKAGGEALGLYTADGAQIDGHVFGPQLTGVSEGRFPDGAPDVVSFPRTDSPGASNFRLLTSVVINEALPHTDPPLEDAIELFNTTDQAIDVGGWWLSDDPGTIQKYQIPSPTIITAHGYAVFYQTTFSNRDDVGTAIPFSLSSKGDEVVLSATAGNVLTGYRTSVKYGASENGVSFGRYVTSTGEEAFVAMSARSLGQDDPGTVAEFRLGTGAPNPYPRIGPVVISEIMYHPPDLGTNDNVRDEFIELHNLTTVPVPLYDPAAPTNTWHLRDAVDFEFPAGTAIYPGDYLLVVSFNPDTDPGALAAFRQTYQLNAGVAIVGPYRGKLANSTDEIELRKPDAPDTNGVAYILVESVRYSDTAPWPALADGTGLSLQRLADAEFGNDPANWTAATPTPGPQAAPLDSDGDGLPDSWENAYGLNPANPADANFDSDGDGLTNLEEFHIGTSPRDDQSVLKLELAASPDQTELSFLGITGHSYTIQFKESVNSPTWYNLSTSEVTGANGTVSLLDPNPMTHQRIYRIITPAVASLPAGPIILESPSGQQTSIGGSAWFQVVAVGIGELEYQWLHNGVPIAGAVSSSLALPLATVQDAGEYSVQITDTLGTSTSQAATLMVKP